MVQIVLSFDLEFACWYAVEVFVDFTTLSLDQKKWSEMKKVGSLNVGDKEDVERRKQISN